MTPIIAFRWYQDPHLDIKTVPAVTYNHVSDERLGKLTSYHDLPGVLQSNPLEKTRSATTHHVHAPTDTVSSRTVFHETQAAIHPLIAGVQMQEQLDSLLHQLQLVRCVLQRDVLLQ
jgi:hypothetical protein